MASSLEKQQHEPYLCSPQIYLFQVTTSTASIATTTPAIATAPKLVHVVCLRHIQDMQMVPPPQNQKDGYQSNSSLCCAPLTFIASLCSWPVITPIVVNITEALPHVDPDPHHCHDVATTAKGQRNLKGSNTMSQGVLQCQCKLTSQATLTTVTMVKTAMVTPAKMVTMKMARQQLQGDDDSHNAGNNEYNDNDEDNHSHNDNKDHRSGIDHTNSRDEDNHSGSGNGDDGDGDKGGDDGD
ncbi:hypothetical protein EDB83DRAFT_2312376 [Lactarius deliciosus]|nr:hypothetical protein EDB83DRAFT_2323074 [Lactarius deliciosus]KAH9074889.1 hypothetical protein EDB83DRAFT_2312376 [Lactarius deliciosus]